MRLAPLIWVAAVGEQSLVRRLRVFEIAQAMAAPTFSDNRGVPMRTFTLGHVQALGMRADAGRVYIFLGVFLVLPRNLIDTTCVYVPSSCVAYLSSQSQGRVGAGNHRVPVLTMSLVRFK